jgi:hypothetical protein
VLLCSIYDLSDPLSTGNISGINMYVQKAENPEKMEDFR